MKYLRLLFLFAALLMVGCSSSGDEPQPEPQPTHKLSTPMLTLSLANNQATIRWTAVEGAKQYEWELSANQTETTTGTTRITNKVVELAIGASYTFRVRAIAENSAQYLDSEWSEQLTLTSNMLMAPEPKLVEGSLTATEVQFEWQAVSNAQKYGWELLDYNSSEKLFEGEVEECKVTVGGLEHSHRYRFRVKALGDSKNYQSSSFSSFVDITTRTIEPLSVPQPRLSAISVGEVTFTWEQVEYAVAYGYELYRESISSEAVLSAQCEQPSVTISSLEEGVTYLFRVKSISSPDDSYASDSEFSDVVSFTTRKEGSVDFGLPLSTETDGKPRAFPGAEGGGMYVTGGRGGKVLHVTTLEDTGNEGSLRWAINQSGARTVVFDVAGTIQLRSNLTIKNGNLTIAGQTAPGDGICLRDYTVNINTDNVIIRYMRFRLGDETKQENDAIWSRYHKNIILDHCSMTWATDECASFYANQNFTMQWCIVGESLRTSIHTKGNHGYGGIWGGKNASFHHNLLTCNDSRNPRIDHPIVYDSYLQTHRGNVDVRNNVIYNWGSNTTYGGEGGWFNMVGNYYKPGPASSKRNYFVDAYAIYDGIDRNYPRLYMMGNYHAGDYATINSDQWSGIYWHNGQDVGDVTGAKKSQLQPVLYDDSQTCYVTTHSAEDAYDAVLSYVGASLKRDAVDVRLTSDARLGRATYTDGGNGSKNGIIDTQSAVGGWPTLTATDEQIICASVDTDKDGIPDYYENLFGLDSSNPADAQLFTLDTVYSNFEVYLHYLVKDITLKQIKYGTYTSLQ